MSTARLTIVVILLTATAVVARSAHRGDRAVAANLAALSYTIDQWRGAEAKPLDEETMDALGADAYLTRTYSDGAGVPVSVYIAFYGAQRPGVSLHSPLHCLPGTGWEPLDVGTVDVAGAPVRRLVVRKNGDRAVVFYWYAVHGRTIASEALSKLWLLHDSIRLGRSDAALVRIVVPIAGAVDAADERGVAFTQDLLPSLAHLWS
jgi:EpsI family protein